MLAWIISFALTGIPLSLPDGPVVAPVDITTGDQSIALRAPLVARTPGTRLVLFVRDLGDTARAGVKRNDAFEQAVPIGSISAELRSADGQTLFLDHTGYTYYRGFAGLVLTEREPGLRRTFYKQMTLHASVSLPFVRFIWLDQLTRTVRDVPPPR